MQPDNAPSVTPVMLAVPERVPLLRILSQILVLGLPLVIGATVTSALHLGKVAMLARVPDTGALHVLSLMQPAFILILALMEGLAITNQVFSARSKHNWPRRGVLRSSACLSLGGLGLFVLLAAAGYAVSQAFSFDDPAIAIMVGHFPGFLMSMGLFLVFDVLYGALRGQGRVFQGLIPFLVLVAVDLGVTYVLVSRLGWGFDAILLGNLAGPAAVLPVMVLLLRRQTPGREGGAEDVPPPVFNARLRQLLVGVGLPVFGSIMIGFISASVVFPILSDLGRDNASAFFVVLRFRIAFMIPAIALGSAIAILANQAAEEGGRGGQLRYLQVGVPVMLAFYALMTLTLPQWGGGMLDLLVPPDAVALRASADLMMSRLLVTFFVVAGSTMLQVILEQLGRGRQVLLITLATEAATCATVVYAVYDNAGLEMVLWSLVVLAGVTFVLLLLQLLALMRGIGRGNAV
ncbi:hypothetical protein ABMY26_01035 [Azospirillum sp. HJ39]|uniref:hypothetical protein n=1 Tax=Azospirillum sp. HJ39 TaxID=3159496 RepID=UPI0035582416